VGKRRQGSGGKYGTKEMTKSKVTMRMLRGGRKEPSCGKIQTATLDQATFGVVKRRQGNRLRAGKNGWKKTLYSGLGEGEDDFREGRKNVEMHSDLGSDEGSRKQEIKRDKAMGNCSKVTTT